MGPGYDLSDDYLAKAVALVLTVAFLYLIVGGLLTEAGVRLPVVSGIVKSQEAHEEKTWKEARARREQQATEWAEQVLQH